jgi:acyl-CoA-dependent ceramide synthase
MFGVFMLSWLVARHVLYLMVCYSVWAHTPDIMPTGCFRRGESGAVVGPLDPPTDRGVTYLLEPLWDSEGLFCYNETVKWSFLSMLLFLQALTLIWFGMIVRVAVKVLKGSAAEDVRSDDEGEEEGEGEGEGEGVEEHGSVVDGPAEYQEGGDAAAARPPLEQEVGVEELDLKGWERRQRQGVSTRRSATTGVSLPGHSDRKELLGRIGCEKQVE